MRHQSTSRALGAAITAAALALVPAIAVSTAAAADPVVVYSHDFEDGTTGSWEGRGAAVEVIDTDGRESTSSLLTTRTTAGDGWRGAALPVGSILTEGTYEIEAWVKLAEPGTAELNLGVNQPGASNEYPWVGGREAVTDTEWVRLAGTYTVLPATPPTVLYVESANDDALVDFLVDDVTITGTPPAPSVTTVWSLDFDDQSIEPWANNGGTHAYVDDGEGGYALAVTRANDWEGIKSPYGVMEAGVEYTFSMRARLPADSDVSSSEIRFVVEPAYAWVGNTTIDADGWTEVTGTYMVPADADPAEVAAYIGSPDLADPYTIVIDDLLVTRPAGTPGDFTPVDLFFDFEDGTLQGWTARDADGEPTVSVTSPGYDDSEYAALVSDRAGQGDGIGYDFGEVFETGATYDITAQVRMASGSDEIWLSAQTGSSSFATVGQFPGIGTEWTEINASYTMGSSEMIYLYFETSYNSGGDGDFLVDDVRVTLRDQTVQDLTPIQDTVPWPVGVAIDERETLGAAAQLTTLHFNQITAENHMKVEAWYDGPWNFRIHPEAEALMDFAADNDLGVYGHVLVWHSQTPAWFFQDEAGNPLTDSAADQQIMRDRMRTHIFNVAEALHEWGDYGGENPFVAWDVVNEVVSDSGEFADGLRRSEWYRILGEEFIDLAFQYADEAFNAGEFVADGADRPIALFINDYNTEQSGKQNRYYALVERLIDRGAPIDGVGHQFHLNLSVPIPTLEAAIVRFQDLGLIQAVTEMDVTVGTPVTTANLIEQGYYYRDAFEVFRDYADDLLAVTIWGLTDNRSWRSAQAPLVFDGSLQAKPAYYGIADPDALEPRLRSAFVFADDVAIDDDAPDSVVWQQLPLHDVGGVAQFQARWAPDALTFFVDVTDADADAADAVELEVEGVSYTVTRDGDADAGVEAVVRDTGTGYVVVAAVPLDPAAEQGQTRSVDVRVVDADDTYGWATAGTTGTFTLVEPLSYVEIPEAATPPVINGEFDEAWDTAAVVTTDKQISGTDGATAEVHLLWSENTLFVLMDVADPELDASASNPWEQDSVEIYVDAGNAKNGPYRYDDTQIRISYQNAVSFGGGGDEAFQAARVESATSITDDGYIVEAAISLLEYGGLGTFHGLDFQVNDATDGVRTSTRNWADPTNLGYQSTARWGVGQLVEGEDDVTPADPAIRLGSRLVPAGGTLSVEVSGFTSGDAVDLALKSWLPGRHGRTVELGQVAVDADGAGATQVTIPRQTAPGLYRVVATQDDLRTSAWVVVLPKGWGHAPWPPGPPPHAGKPWVPGPPPHAGIPGPPPHAGNPWAPPHAGKGPHWGSMTAHGWWSFGPQVWR